MPLYYSTPPFVKLYFEGVAFVVLICVEKDSSKSQTSLTSERFDVLC